MQPDPADLETMPGTCLLCQPAAIVGTRLLDHIRLLHPDVYGDGPDRWPDGGLVLVDQSLEPGHFTEPSADA